MTKQLIWKIIEDFAAIEITGLQAGEFLQGQFTCDIHAIKPGQAVAGACCDHKGRMLVNGFIGKLENHFILFVPSVLATLTADHLQKFAVFSKVQLSNKSDWQALVYYSNELINYQNETILQGQALPTRWLIGESHLLKPIQEEFKKTTPPASEDDLNLLLIQHKIAFVLPSTRGLFIPQMLGLEKLGGVSFQKGCYVGQEVIARTQHLGQLKRQLQILKLTCPLADKPAPGDAIIDGHNEIMGQAAAIAPDKTGGFHLLAVVQDRALAHPLFTALHHPLVLSSPPIS